MTMIFTFWILLALIIYCFFGYPLLLTGMARLQNRPVAKSSGEPGISILIAVWNEEDVIEAKISMLLALDYPADKIEILVGSDGSTDRTEEIVRSFGDPRIVLVTNEQRLGKVSVVNQLVRQSRYDILVFNDARQTLADDALRQLVANFADPSVGCVSGELIFHPKDGATAKGINLYWEYEKFLRHQESKIHSMLGATGAIYAIRKELFTPVPKDIILDDMYIPFKIIEKNFRVVFDPDAHAYDHVADNPSEEYRRKARTLYGNFQIFTHFGHMFIPWRSPIAIQFFSHKFLRVAVPFFMIILLWINLLLLKQPFFRWIMGLQILFYALAALGAWGRGRNSGILHFLNKVCYIPYVFCLLNFSAFVGFWRFVRSKQEITWQKARRPS